MNNPLRRHRRRRSRVSTIRQRSEFKKLRLSEPKATIAAPFEQVRAPSAAVDASERTGAHLSARLVVTAVVVVLLFVGLVLRLWVLQVREGPSFYNQANATTTRQVAIEPERGEILAAGGQALATNIGTEEVLVDPSVIQAYPSVIPALASLLGVPVASMQTEIDKAAVQTGPFVSVAVEPGPAGVTQSDVTYIKEHQSIFNGVSVESGFTRSYPYDALASQLIGYLHQPTPGVMTGAGGLEDQYEKVLHGRPGSQTIFVSSTGEYEGVAKTTAETPGDNVDLNLSLPLEEELQNALGAQVQRLRIGAATGKYEPATWAAGVVMTKTGKVLAMASLPNYDANWLVQPISDAHYAFINNSEAGVSPALNCAMECESPPGSTFKLVTGTAALDDGIISPDTPIDDTGQFTYGTQTYSDSEGENLGEVDMTSALAESSDYYFYSLGRDFWEQNPKTTPIQNVGRAYGIGVSSGIDLSNEEELGQIDSPALRIAQHNEDPAAFPFNIYQGGDNVDLAIGQGETEATPLEMAVAYETFVNHGTRYAPELASEITSPTGKVIEKFAPKVMGKVALPSTTWGPMYAGFLGAISDPKGTAYPAFAGDSKLLNAWTVAGKTGTADITNNSSLQPTSWFVGFGGPNPATQYIVVVCIYQAGFGAQGSAPVVRQIFDYLQAHGTGPVTAATKP